MEGPFGCLGFQSATGRDRCGAARRGHCRGLCSLGLGVCAMAKAKWDGGARGGARRSPGGCVAISSTFGAVAVLRKIGTSTDQQVTS